MHKNVDCVMVCTHLYIEMIVPLIELKGILSIEKSKYRNSHELGLNKERERVSESSELNSFRNEWIRN
jgi:hypothetical protein